MRIHIQGGMMVNRGRKNYFSHGSGKDAHAPVFYLHVEPENCWRGVWHPDNGALTRMRTAVVVQTERWTKVRRKLELEGDSLTRAPRGYDREHPFIEDIKRKDFVTSVAFSDGPVCGPAFMGDFAAGPGRWCRWLSSR
jgi:uncharacterized protein (TIGR02453 family)